MLLPEEEVDPMMVKAKLAASEDMAKITFFHKISDLKDAMKSQLIGSQRVGFIIDAQTSRQKVTIGFLEFYLRGGPPVFLLLQRRADCLEFHLARSAGILGHTQIRMSQICIRDDGAPQIEVNLNRV